MNIKWKQCAAVEESHGSLGFVSYLSRVLQLQHAGVIMGFACSCFGGANEVTQSFGHIFHCIDQDHL